VHSFGTAVPAVLRRRTGAVLGTAVAAVALSAASVLPAVAGHTGAVADGPAHLTTAASPDTAAPAGTNEIDWP
jgi:hypothetical protein